MEEYILYDIGDVDLITHVMDEHIKELKKLSIDMNDMFERNFNGIQKIIDDARTQNDSMLEYLEENKEDRIRRRQIKKNICNKERMKQYEKECAVICYKAYADAVDNKSFNGEDLKEFDHLPEKIQIAWLKAYQSSARKYIEICAQRNKREIVNECIGINESCNKITNHQEKII